MFLCYVFLLDIWMRIKALCSLKYRTSIIHMITLPYNKNVDIKECMKFTMLSELFFTTTLFTMLYVSVSILPTRRQPFHDRIICLRGLGPQYSEHSERSCYLCVTISILPVSTIILLEFWILLTMSRLVNQMVSATSGWDHLSRKIYKRVHGKLFYLIFLDISRHVLKIRECYSLPIWKCKLFLLSVVKNS